MLTDQRSVFQSKELESDCDISEIRLMHSGTQTHNSLGLCEKYKCTLRKIYMKLKCDYWDTLSHIAFAQFV